MTDIIKYENYLLKKWQTFLKEAQSNGDIVIDKPFVKNGKQFYLTARFTKHDDFCYGYLTDDNGTAIVNGKGFSLDEFINFIEITFKGGYLK